AQSRSLGEAAPLGAASMSAKSAATPPWANDLKAAVDALIEGSLSARAYCEACVERVRSSEPSIKAWVAFDEGRALAIAATRDVRDAHGALHGIPVGVKDIFDTDDLPTEMGSPAFTGNRPAKNALLVERIVAAGGYAMGK